MAQTMRRVKPVPKLTKIADYAGVAEVTGKQKVEEDWEDKSIISEGGLALGKLDYEEMDKECKIFLYGMRVKMSSRGAAAALVLTWNMRSTGSVEELLFHMEDPGKDPQDKAVEELEVVGEVYQDQTTDTLYNVQPGFLRRQAVSFMAASTLKLFSKSAGSWTEAWENRRIAKLFRDLTKKEFPFSTLRISKDRVSGLADLFHWPRLYTWTLGKILFSLADLKDQRQTTMLFEQHLFCTGMHIVPYFITANFALGATTEDLLCALDMRQNTATLLQLKHLINNSLCRPRGPDNRGTWSYSRLFDEKAFRFLQTRYCQDTVAILAYINTMATGKGEAIGPLQIVAIRQMGAARLRGARVVADNIFTYFTARKARKNVSKMSLLPHLCDP